MSIPITATESAAQWWLRCYRRRPRITVLVSIVSALSFGTILFLADKHEKQVAAAQRQQTLDYQTQLAELSKTETSLRNLIEFVQSQKTKLRESEDVISTLREEQQRLKPFVEADRKVVQAVFDLQEERSRTSIHRERWIGFGLGVVASVVASFIYAVVVLVWRRYAQKIA